MAMPRAVSDQGNPKVADKPSGGDFADDLEVIRERTRETLALLRQLIGMLLPKGDPDKPTLEELITALVAQQARVLAIVGQLGADMSAVLELLTRVPESAAGTQRQGSGGPRPC
jgi:hypothetical protein